MTQLELPCERIVIAHYGELLLNMVYSELGEEPSETFGSFSGRGGDGMFHISPAGNLTLSSDWSCIDSAYSTSITNQISAYLDSMRSEFEIFNQSGEIIGLSRKGKRFLESSKQAGPYQEAFSEKASDELIFMLQDEWNLDFML